MFLNVLAIIIMAFGENVIVPKYIDIYQFRGLAGMGVGKGCCMVHLRFLFIIDKNGKSTRD